ncbi:MAG: C40 family peptidase [Planctomycetes bacterium]|nr:C40 family peptidase [Planctomycetota bacterium]
MLRMLMNASLIGVTCGLLIVRPAEAQEAPSTRSEKSRIQAYYQRIIGKIEPGLVGSPERLPLYMELFRREMITDSRLFPFRVEAEWMEKEGRVVLRGFVGYEENRAALSRFMHHLGFEHVEDRIEVLPSKELGSQRFGFVKASHSLSLDSPTGRQEVLTDCLLGAPVYLLKEADEGFLLCQGVEGYVGYVNGKDIRRVDRKEFRRYQSGAQVRTGRDFRTAEGLFVPTGARLKHVGRRGQNVVAELPTGNETIIPADFCEIRDGSPGSRINRVIENASKMLGTKYLWGGNTSEGIDCSGLMQTSFAAEGIGLPRDSNQQIYLGSLTATRWCRDGLRRGDTLFFLGKTGKVSHTAIYLGDGRYLEAVRPVVRYTSFNPEDDDYDEGRDAAFCFAKRLLE